MRLTLVRLKKIQNWYTLFYVHVRHGCPWSKYKLHLEKCSQKYSSPHRTWEKKEDKRMKQFSFGQSSPCIKLKNQGFLLFTWLATATVPRGFFQHLNFSMYEICPRNFRAMLCKRKSKYQRIQMWKETRYIWGTEFYLNLF